MLFKQPLLERIVAGEVTLAFRRWRKQSAVEGGRMRTPLGVLEVVSVREVTPERISEKDARLAGAGSKRELMDAVNEYKTGTLYRIELRFAGADPRIALRNTVNPSAAEFEAIRKKLARYDAGKYGAWTRPFLMLIGKNPGLVAGELARKAGRSDVQSLKLDVRKLKELGLTESLPRGGYRLSPRGEEVLKRL